MKRAVSLILMIFVLVNMLPAMLAQPYTDNYKFSFNPNSITDNYVVGFTGTGYQKMQDILTNTPINSVKNEIKSTGSPAVTVMNVVDGNGSVQVFFYGKVRTANSYNITFELTDLFPLDNSGTPATSGKHYKVSYDFINVRVAKNGNDPTITLKSKKVPVDANGQPVTTDSIVSVPVMDRNSRTNLTSWFWGRIDIKSQGIVFDSLGKWAGTVTMVYSAN